MDSLAVCRRLRHAAIASLAFAASITSATSAALAQAGGDIPRDTVRQAPSRDTAARLATVVVTGTEARPAVGHLPAVHGGIIYGGQKTELITLDSLRLNRVQDVMRQVLGRIPGANISETESSGFPSNGIGFRGLDPTQSIEINTRQNGVNIAADLYGYPETYYTPPMEAVDHIEVVRGASALQFGPQFGGMINYVMKSGAPDTPPTFTAQETGGSFGTFNSFTSLGGGRGPWTYYGFLQYRTEQGWRANSDFNQMSAYGNVGYRVSDGLSLRLEYSLFRNRIHMPGGLSDAQFGSDARQSFRARNWLASPWNIVALHVENRFSPEVTLFATASVMRSQRYLVWRNEDGGPQASDSIDPATGDFVPREVERERFTNVTTEARLQVEHRLFGRAQTLATGARLFSGTLGRQDGGPGSTGSDFDMGLYGGGYENDLTFGTRNAALFAQDLIHLTDRWSLTPGVRYEILYSTARGHEDTNTVHQPAKTRSYPLFGVGSEYLITRSTSLYANITQAYRPITYDFLTPFASASRIDPHMKDASGYTADLGWRGDMGPALHFDVGVFYLWYDNRIGVVTRTDANGQPFTEVTNVARSIHKGVESYVQLNPLALLGRDASPLGHLELFDSFAYVDARYAAGPFAGHEVEAAPPIINRVGLTYGIGGLATTVQLSHTARSYADANNTVASDDAAVGLVPAFDVLDWSGAVPIGERYRVELGVNNVTNARYFTKRTAEYPGPGIIPGMGRSVYVTVGATVR
ncbi:MAG TPA: TonB-dependent receptor [Gemmatimonadaceae bacterium]